LVKVYRFDRIRDARRTARLFGLLRRRRGSVRLPSYTGSRRTGIGRRKMRIKRFLDWHGWKKRTALCDLHQERWPDLANV